MVASRTGGCLGSAAACFSSPKIHSVYFAILRGQHSPSKLVFELY